MVDHASRKAARLAKYAAKRTAANLLKGHDEKQGKRLSQCCYVSHGGNVELVRREYANGEVSAGVQGVVTCKSVWCCPICSERISAQRRDELNGLLAWARAEGHAVVMLTLTARHDRSMALAPFVAALKEAGRKLRQSKGWRALDLVGSVQATEVTHGANGWHPHFHAVLIVRGSEAAALDAVERLRPEWLRSLEKCGLNGAQAAFQVQPASAVGDYVAKFGAAEELALGVSKLGRNGSRSPWQLLADARDGDKRAAALWIEFAKAFKGRAQLQWSRGLRELAAIDEIESQPESEVVAEKVVRAWPGKSEYWKAARRRLVALLDAAESGSCLDAAEYGATDAARWREEIEDGQVLE